MQLKRKYAAQKKKNGINRYVKKLDRDNIDFANTDITKLFVNILVPTLLGMVSNSLLNIADGIIVGKGVSSDALAAVNISAALYLISSSVALLFASGVSIVAAIHLSKGNIKAANINMTQSLLFPAILMSFLSAIMLLFPKELNYIFGGSEKLFPLVREYVVYLFPMPVLFLIQIIGTFIIRLDGAPRYAMYISAIPAFINSVLDWVFVFPLQMGIKGAAIATVISMLIGTTMVMTYLLKYSKTLHLYLLKFSRTSLYLSMRNLKYMAKVGLPTFIEEGALAFMIVIGNHMFMRFLHEDGVAAFSVVCYLFPLIFMFGNGIAQSQMPIISYNHGLGDKARIMKTINVSIMAAIALGIVILIIGILLCDKIMIMFLDEGSNAYEIATRGFPLFAVSFFFFTINLVIIGIYQSLSQSGKATFYTLLRGIIFMIPCFLFVPNMLGEQGLWLAVPIAEAITFVIMYIDYKKNAIRII